MNGYQLSPGIHSGAMLALVVVTACLVGILVKPSASHAKTTQVLSGDGIVRVNSDNDPHDLYIYNSTLQLNPSPIFWGLFSGGTGSALAEAEAAAIAEPTIWGEVIVGILALATVALHEQQSSQVEAVLMIFDAEPGAVVDPSEPCRHARDEDGALYPALAECPLTPDSHLFVKTGSAPDSVNLSAILCCFDPHSKNIEIRTDASADSVVGSKFAELIEGGPGNDVVFAGDGPDYVYGFRQYSPFQDLMNVGSRVTSDVHYGDVPAPWAPDHDRLFGEEGIDVMSGGPGDDLVDGGEQDDRSSALVVNDDSVFPALDTMSFYELLGGGGDDVVVGGPGTDGMEGGPGRDTLLARESDYRLRDGSVAIDEKDRVDCGRPSITPPDGPEYYRISKPSPETPNAPLDVLATCTDELATAPNWHQLTNWPPGQRWWWYQ